MGIEVAGTGGFILLILIIWALISIVGSNSPMGAKVIWCLFVLLLPLIGFIVWLIAGPRARKTASI